MKLKEQLMDFFRALEADDARQGVVVQTPELSIPGLNEPRPLSLYLPPGFEVSGTEPFPVAYFFDGQNLFTDKAHSAGKTNESESWQMDRILARRWRKGLQVPVIVGIHHGDARDAELSPWPLEAGQQALGDQLLAWMVDELHPLLLAHLPLASGPEHTALGGSSLGGLMALYGCMKYSHVFGQGICMSPSLWVSGGAIYDYLDQLPELYLPEFMRLYIDAGQCEGNAPDEPVQELGDSPADDVRDLLACFRKLGLVQGQSFQWVEDPVGKHQEASWRKRLPQALDFLYAPLQEPQVGQTLDIHLAA